MFKETDKSDIKKTQLLLTIFTCIIVIFMEVGYFRHSHVVFIISIPAIITLASIFALVLRRIDLKQRRNMELIRKASERLEIANSQNAYISRALRKHLTQYRTLLANLPVGIFRSTPDGQYLSANPAMVKILGYDTEDELKSVYIPDLYFDPNDRKAIFDELHQTRSGQGFEVRMKRRNGSIIWVSSSIRVILDDNDQPLYYDGILKDITERKRADAALQEMHDLNRAVVENSPVGISVRDRHGRLLSYNDAWQKIWAIPDEVIRDYMSRPRSSLNFDTRDSYLGEWQDDVKRIYKEGGYLYIPEVLSESHRPGSSRFVSQHFCAVKDNDGQVDRVIILTEDMTTRKTAEEMFSTIFVISPIPTLITELDSGTIIDANKAFTDLVQLNREQVIGYDTLDLGIWNAESDREKMVERIRASKCAANFPVTIINSAGNQRECLVSAELIELGDKPRLVTMMVDITDRRKMEDEMVRREKLDSIGLLAGGIA